MKKFITVIVAGMILSLAGMNVYAQDKSEQQILQEKVSALVSSEIEWTIEDVSKLEEELSDICSPDDYAFVVTKSKKGDLYYAAGNYEMVIEEYKAALGIAKNQPDCYKNFGSVIAYLSGSIGEIYYIQGKYTESIPYYEEYAETGKLLYDEEGPEFFLMYDRLGLANFFSENYAVALTYLQKELPIAIKLYGEYSRPVAQVYSNIGAAYQSIYDYGEALTYYEKSLDIQEYLPDEGTSNMSTLNTKSGLYNNIGSIYYANGDYDNSLKYLKKALSEAYKENGGKPSLNMRNAYSNMGLIYQDKEEFDSALSCYNEALKIHTELTGTSDIGPAATIYNNIGMLLASKKEYLKAAEYIRKAMAIKEYINGKNHPDTADTYYGMGTVYNGLGDYDKALSFFKDAIKIYENEARGVNYNNLIKCYTNVVLAYNNKNDYKNALLYSDKALDIVATKLPNYPHAANIYVNRGNIYWRKGDYKRSLVDYEKAANLLKEIFGEKYSTIATCYNNMGLVCVAMKDYEAALSFYNKSLEVCKDVDYLGVALVYNNLSALYRKKGDFDGAVNYLERALKIYEDKLGKNHPDTARALSNLGLYYCIAKKDYTKGIAYMKEAFEIQKKMLPEGNCDLANTCNNIALAYADTKKTAQAKVYWNRMIACLRKTSDYGELFDLMRRFIFADGVDEATRSDMLSIGIVKIEQARRDLSSLKTEITRKCLPIYYYGVQFRSRQEKPEKAFEYSEALRSRGFLDQVGTDAALKLQGVTEQERTKIYELSAKINEARRIIEQQNNVVLSQQDATLISQVSSDLDKAEKELLSLDDIIGKRIPAYKRLRNPKTVSAKDAIAWCGKDRAILEYVIWNPKLAEGVEGNTNLDSYCLVITDTEIKSIKLDGAYNYGDAVAKLQDKIANLSREGTFEGLRNELYEKLIEPVLPYISGKKYLLIVPDGNLSILPFEVLRKDYDSEMVGERFAVALSPSVSVSMIAGRGKHDTVNVLAFGGAWYDTVAATGRWHDLPGTITELNTLKADVFSDTAFSEVVGESASEKNVKKLSLDGSLSRYAIVHFACHGHFASLGSDEPSSLLFSEISGKLEGQSMDDGYLTIPEAAVLNLNADMVCLSACETGLVEMSEGDGMVGLSRAFMVAGANHVGVSLWEADDEAAAAFMTSMYRKVVQEGLDYVEAYQKTKAEFRESDDWDHPFYWAVYTLYE